MSGARWRLIASILCLLAAAGGCGSPPYFQVETVVRSDGSCDRTIWQPEREMLPAEALRPAWAEHWRTIRTFVAPPAFADKIGKGGERSYFTATGSFRSPMEIPGHFRNAIEGCPEVGASELVRTYERKECGFVLEYCWSERLTNIVTRAGFFKARDEFLDLALPLAVKGIEQVYGNEFDVSGLVSYVRAEGRRLLEQAAEALYDAGVAHEPERGIAIRLATVARRFGLDLFDANGELLESQDSDPRFEAFLRHRILLGVRHRDGSRLTEAEFRSLVPKDSAPRFVEAWNRFAREHATEFETKLLQLIVRMTGLYGSPLGPTANIPEFAFALRLPGAIVETNGDPEGRDKVRWRFTGDRSFPDGYAMTARSFEIDIQGQKAVLGHVAIGDRTAAEAFIKLVREDEDLLDAVRQAVRKGDPMPLREFRPRTDEGRDRLRRLHGLLKDW
jgi:hypothetical protein